MAAITLRFVIVHLLEHLGKLALQNLFIGNKVGIPSAGRDAAKVGKESVPVTGKGTATFELIQNTKLADTVGYGCGKGVIEVIDVLLCW